MNTHAAADLHEEVRRLRIRITSLASSPHPGHNLDAVLADGRNRRQAIREALSTLAALSLTARPARSSLMAATGAHTASAPEVPAGSVPTVPDLGDRVIADQLVVLLLDCAPEYGANPAVTEKARDIAVQLRRELA